MESITLTLQSTIILITTTFGKTKYTKYIQVTLVCDNYPQDFISRVRVKLGAFCLFVCLFFISYFKMENGARTIWLKSWFVRRDWVLEGKSL